MSEATRARVAAIRKALAAAEDPLPVLKDSLEGKVALLVSCGPSMAQWREIHAALADQDPILVCVKQAVLEARELCDLHFVNFSNLQKYPIYSDHTITFYLGDEDHPGFTKYDVIYKLDSKQKDLKDCLSSTRNFSSNTIDLMGISRPRGPGIIQESVLYTLVYMGIKRIVTIGWDIADQTGTNMHYHDHPIGASGHPAERLLRELAKSTLRKLRLFEPARKLVNRFRLEAARTAFAKGQVCFRSRMEPGEAALVASSIPDLIAWIRSEGVELEIISNSRWMASRREPPAPGGPLDPNGTTPSPRPDPLPENPLIP